MFEKEIRDMKIIDGRTASRTFISGGLGSTSFMIALFSGNEMIAFLMGITLAWSLFMLFDAVFPFNKRFHGLTAFLFFITGIICAAIASPVMYIYLMLMIAGGLAIYRHFISTLMGREESGSEQNNEEI